MGAQKFLLNTFDYELFLGERSGTVENCLIIPTEKILRLLNKNHITGVFFIDTTYLIRLKDTADKFMPAKNDYNKIVLQIRTMIKSGHYVFPHIHPHWLDAVYNEIENQWDLSNISKYRFHNISIQERELLFETSLNILHEIIHESKPDYKIDSYRAGGWTIQPFEDYKPFFLQYNIKFDFSVLPGFSEITTAQHFDFRKIPGKNIYRFENDIINEEEKLKM